MTEQDAGAENTQDQQIPSQGTVDQNLPPKDIPGEGDSKTKDGNLQPASDEITPREVPGQTQTFDETDPAGKGFRLGEDLAKRGEIPHAVKGFLYAGGLDILKKEGLVPDEKAKDPAIAQMEQENSKILRGQKIAQKHNEIDDFINKNPNIEFARKTAKDWAKHPSYEDLDAESTILSAIGYENFSKVFSKPIANDEGGTPEPANAKTAARSGTGQQRTQESGKAPAKDPRKMSNSELKEASAKASKDLANDLLNR